uniref:Uncharacterized protein n=1 Tax=Picea sitchensis TaxID=3332 RepID=A9NQ12_PICSI|nr:unknown [Picea sitchensis]
MWITAELLCKNILKKFYPRKAEWLIQQNQPTKVYFKPSSKYHGKEPRVNGEEDIISNKESQAQLAAAFSKPPMPPLFGPFFVFSILEMLLHTEKKNE